jgi:hypothetical protein
MCAEEGVCEPRGATDKLALRSMGSSSSSLTSGGSTGNEGPEGSFVESTLGENTASGDQAWPRQMKGVAATSIDACSSPERTAVDG